MITSLYIQNVALISKLSLNFDSGLTVLSGETGSGGIRKSRKTAGDGYDSPFDENGENASSR